MARLLEVFEANSLDGRIIVVDDGPPTAPARSPIRWRQAWNNLSVIHRKEKQGIRPAYVAGFKQVDTNTDFIFEMDCDFSHDPANIPAFLKAIEQADLVLGFKIRPREAGRELGADAGPTH